jgi:hypothetical protein
MMLHGSWSDQAYLRVRAVTKFLGDLQGIQSSGHPQKNNPSGSTRLCSRHRLCARSVFNAGGRTRAVRPPSDVSQFRFASLHPSQRQVLGAGTTKARPACAIADQAPRETGTGDGLGRGSVLEGRG